LAVFLPVITGASPNRELRCRAAVASTLVAGLELARIGGLGLEQDRPWKPIRVQPGKGGCDATLRPKSIEQYDHAPA
jgi:chromatin segregation and condensation protein Rec8/ScpA/Scc1 (kleisin family)